MAAVCQLTEIVRIAMLKNDDLTVVAVELVGTPIESIFKPAHNPPL
jgi:hypothetical protein